MCQRLIILEKIFISISTSKKKLENISINHKIYQTNDILIGKIYKLIPGLKASFINLIPDEKNGLIYHKDLESKTLKKNNNNLFKNPKILDYTLVQITKEPTKTKGPHLTGKLYLPGKYSSIQPLSKSIRSKKKPPK